MREIDVPLINGDTCQAMLRNNTVLGNQFGLDKNSFVCAGKKFNIQDGKFETFKYVNFIISGGEAGKGKKD